MLLKAEKKLRETSKQATTGRLIAMAFLFLKKFTLLFILISASLLPPASFAGRPCRHVHQDAIEVGPLIKESSKKQKEGMNDILYTWKESSKTQKERRVIHKRVLKVQTKDYETYDPAPAEAKPPYKLIPN